MSTSYQYDRGPRPGARAGDRPRRYVIVNADDFGLSARTNSGIVKAHREGVVTSASLMVRQPAAEQAAAMAADCPRLGIGLHVDLGEWIYRNSEWTSLYEVVPLDSAQAVQDEVEFQLDRFRKLFKRDPTHLDSHQHVHRHNPARTVLLAMAARLNVPLRHFSSMVIHRGDFYGQDANGTAMPQAISVQALLHLLSDLNADVTEIGGHPGFDDTLITMYSAERPREVATLCDERITEAAVKLGIKFISFADLKGVASNADSDRNHSPIPRVAPSAVS